MGGGAHTAQTEMGSVGIPNKGKDVRYQVMDVRTLNKNKECCNRLAPGASL